MSANTTVNRLLHHHHLIVTTGDISRLTQATSGMEVTLLHQPPPRGNNGHHRAVPLSAIARYPKTVDNRLDRRFYSAIGMVQPIGYEQAHTPRPGGQRGHDWGGKFRLISFGRTIDRTSNSGSSAVLKRRHGKTLNCMNYSGTPPCYSSMRRRAEIAATVRPQSSDAVPPLGSYPVAGRRLA